MDDGPEKADEHTLRWLSLRDYVPGPHVSGKIAVVGQAPTPGFANMPTNVRLTKRPTERIQRLRQITLPVSSNA
jgi:hypothetical protein